MKQLIILILFSIGTTLYSQPMLEIGTKWTYSQFSLLNFRIEPSILSITGDTLINGTKWFRLEGDRSCPFPNPADLPFIREENRRWFVYTTDTQIESLLYDFSLVAGDTLFVNLFEPDFTVTFPIDSVGTKVIDGTLFNVQYIGPAGLQHIEGIGSNNYLFTLDKYSICDPEAGPIRCFENTTDFVDFDPTRDCDEVHSPTSTNNLPSNHKIQLSPNPATTANQIEINSPIEMDRIEVFNQYGVRVLSKTCISTKSTIKVKDPGLYYVTIYMGDKSVTERLVVVKNE